MITLENRINAARGIAPITPKQRRVAKANARISHAIRHGLPLDRTHTQASVLYCTACITIIALFAGLSGLFVDRL